MPYLVGTDEAGLGPNLGPLMIASTVWWVDQSVATLDLFETLAGVVCNMPDESDSGRIPIADSKCLYKAGQGLHHLEHGFLTALACLGNRPGNWQQLWSSLCPDVNVDCREIPWHADFELDVPIAVESALIERQSNTLLKACQSKKVKLVSMHCRAIFPKQFNELTLRLGNKSAALSHWTLELLRDVLDQLPAEPVTVYADKHGARNFYAPLLQHFFSDRLIEIVAEGNLESLYRWGPAEQRVEIGFRVGSERFLPTALASMTAKYMRELCMLAFNRFWRTHLPDLRPTAGYPADARRFKAEIDACQIRLGIADQLLWRCR
ncbi:MAG: hypothetical protein SGJ20_12650 [Planctomycetota bacterium]|nr:hypothetical protein [Planctomycetota bacterium]